MDNDPRDRRDWPASDPSGETRDEVADEATRPAGEEPIPADEPIPAADSSTAEPPPAPDWGATEPTPPPPTPDEATAEMESWPSQDAVPSDEADAGVPSGADAGPAFPDDAEAAAAARAWPTEPPAAGSAGEGTWPTTPPERSDDPVTTAPDDDSVGSWTSEPDTSGAPPEVEAHPGAAEPPLDASGAATVAAAGAATAQTVPDAEAAATGESTQCPRCGTENRPGLAFCRNCGQRLVAAGVATTVERPSAPEGSEACPRCGTHNRAGTAFCQNCGANLRGSAEGYVPPAVAGEATAPAAGRERGAVLGPVVLLIGLIGLVTGYLLPFLYGSDSLFDRAFGADGYGAAFWSGYPDVGAALADQAYFGLAAPVPLLGLLLLLLAGAGFVRARPGSLQTLGLIVALAWSVGLAVLFVVVEVAGNFGGDIVGLLRELTPAGIIFFLASLIVIIGTLTRFGRS